MTQASTNDTFNTDSLGDTRGVVKKAPQSVAITITDDFARANSSTDLGNGWIALQGVWGILNNAAQVVTASSGTSSSGLRDVAVRETNAHDGIVTVKATTTNSPTGIAFRVSDALNFMMFCRTSAGNKLYRVTAGNSVELGVSALTSAPGDIMSAEFNGANITVKVNGANAVSVVDSFNMSATKHGVLARSYTGALFDDFNFNGKSTVIVDTAMPISGRRLGVFGSSSSMDGYAGFKKYYRFIQDRIGIVPMPVAINGTQLQSPNADYRTVAGNQLGQIDSLPTDLDVVIGQVGINDERNAVTVGTMGSTSVQDFYGALDVMCRKLHDKYPTTPIGILTGQYYTPNTATSSAYITAIKDVCGYYGIPVLELTKVGRSPYGYAAWRTAHVPDGLHMDDQSNLNMSYIVESFILSLLGK